MKVGNIREGFWLRSVKTLMVSILFLTIRITCFAQGQVIFANLGAGVNAPISDLSGNRIIGPSTCVAHLFWSADTNATMDSLASIGVDEAFISQSYYGYGYFFGGGVTLPVVGAQIVAQIRVWNTNYGATYYEARDKGGDFGFSNLVIVWPVLPPGPPGPLTGLQSFQLERLPQLSIAPAATNTLLFSWPTNITNYAVQQNTDLSTKNWTTITTTPVVIDSQNQISLAKPENKAFYRLISQ